MKNTFIFFIIIIASIATSFSQCPLNPFIEENYEIDAKILALRDILSDINDPDYNNPIIPNSRFTPYLEKLSAIYDQAENEPLINLLINDYQIHANVNAINTIYVPFKRIVLFVNNETTWLDNFITTGISGNVGLDQLVANYQFVVINSGGNENITWLKLQSEMAFINITALKNDFENINGIDFAEPSNGPLESGNYIGIPYEFVPGVYPNFTDMVVEGDQFTFSLHGGDCPSGCIYNNYWTITVTEDCEVTLLSTPNNSLTNFSISPNPTSDFITLSGVSHEITSVTIYTIQGQIVKTSHLENKTVDVSTLTSGMYFLMIQTNDGRNSIQKFIKN